MPASTKTAKDAAHAVGCDVSHIVKSLAFRSPDGDVVLILAAGDARVNETVLATRFGGPVRLAEPAVVRDVTGFAIGGVAPVGLATKVPVFMDEALLRHERVWAAAGTPRSVFPIAPAVLRRITAAEVLDVRGDS